MISEATSVAVYAIFYMTSAHIKFKPLRQMYLLPVQSALWITTVDCHY